MEPALERDGDGTGKGVSNKKAVHQKDTHSVRQHSLASSTTPMNAKDCDTLDCSRLAAVTSNKPNKIEVVQEAKVAVGVEAAVGACVALRTTCH